MFNVSYSGKHGRTITVDEPNIDALKYAAYLASVLHVRYSLISHDDLTVTVHGDGLDSLTFEPCQTVPAWPLVPRYIDGDCSPLPCPETGNYANGDCSPLPRHIPIIPMPSIR